MLGIVACRDVSPGLDSGAIGALAIAVALATIPALCPPGRLLPQRSVSLHSQLLVFVAGVVLVLGTARGYWMTWCGGGWARGS